MPAPVHAFQQGRITLHCGDITEHRVDAIVNAANRSLLAACYRNALRLAADNGLHSIAFPAISTGAYGFPPEQAAGIASRTLEATMLNCPTVNEVRLVFFDLRQLHIFLNHQEFSG